MVLGTPGQAGSGPYGFNEPCDVVTAANGDIFVADGHGGQNRAAPPDTAARIAHQRSPRGHRDAVAAGANAGQMSLRMTGQDAFR